jgi:hypothetical protein
MRPIITQQAGQFLLPARPGFYTVHVHADGFEDLWLTVVIEEPGHVLYREFVLESSSPSHRSLRAVNTGKAVSSVR